MARLTYTQIASFLNDAYADSVGANAPLDSLSFSTLQQLFGTSAINAQDNLYGVLETVIGKTLFAVRPLSEDMKSLEWSPQRYGDIVRKVTPITTDALDDAEWTIAAEAAKQNPDFACCTAPVLQDFLSMRLNSGNTYARKHTIYKNQMNAAFHSQPEVEDFFSMMATERVNRMKIDRVNEKRALVNNAIMAIVNNHGGSSSVFDALTEYNNETGQNYDKYDIKQPGIFREFMIWLAAKIEMLRRLMAENNNLFHLNITGKEVQRHTPYNKQKLYLAAEYEAYFRANMAQLYHPERLPEFNAVESIPYWQSPVAPMEIKGDYRYLSSAGVPTTESIPDVAHEVIGILFDEDFMGLSAIDQWTAPEPFNARYGYQNTWYHSTYRSITDFTENAIVIRLETPSQQNAE